MSSKYEVIRDLWKSTTFDVVKTPEAWVSFLTTAAQHYKYPFEDQILIHAQRPGATACASFEDWNNKLHRRIKKGAKGIALLADPENTKELRFVFDVSDTYSIEPLSLWKHEPRFENTVTESLEANFGELRDKNSFLSALSSSVANAVEDNSEDYFSRLMEDPKFSMTEDGAIESFEEILFNSVTFMASVRCGYDGVQIKASDFQGVTRYNSDVSVSCLGEAINNISATVLHQIAETEKACKEEEKKRNTKGGQTYGTENNVQRGTAGEAGTDIQASGGLSAAGHRTGTGEAIASESVRTTSPEIFQGDTQEPIHEHAVRGDTLSIPSGDQRQRLRQMGADHQPNGKSTGSDRSAQNARHDEVGGYDEQHPISGEGDRERRDRIQLELFPTVEQQIEELEEAEEMKTSAFFMSQLDIDHVLARGSGIHEGKYRIYFHYLEHPSVKDSISFLKEEYGWGGGTIDFPSGKRGWHESSAKGISIRQNRDGSEYIEEIKLALDWKKVDKRLRELIAADRYLTPKEEQNLALMKQEYISPVEPRIVGRGSPERQQREQPSQEVRSYSVSVGDTVFIGTDEYILVFCGEETAILQDSRFPLLTQTFTREEFDQKIRENPLNNHLVATAEKTVPAKQPDQTISLPGVAEYDIGDLVIFENSKGVEKLAEIAAIEEHSVLISMDKDKIVSFPRNEFDEILRSDERNEHLFSDEQFVPAWEKEKQVSDIPETILCPEDSKRINFHITNDDLGIGGAKTKYGFNVDAIRLLSTLDSKNRLATAQEQATLSKYVGWGGLPMVFDEKNAQWANEHRELTSLLTEKEYESARESTLNAHYTSPVVIRAMYQAIEDMGFKTGNILEPAMGIGNFFGLVPDSMKQSKLYGVELDGITGKIAKQLYQNANIAVQGFEESSVPDTFFDLAIGNVPFGQYKIADKRYDKHNFLVHDYFFAKTLDKVRPGGIIAFITSKGTLDKQNPAVRRYIAQRADLIGAIRLPNNAFLSNAGTGVTADILFLQKRDRAIDIDPDWVHLSKTNDGIPINSFFVSHPEMVLGTMINESTQYGREESTCEPIKGADLAVQLSAAITHLSAAIKEYDMDDVSEKETESIPADPTVRNFSFVVVEGTVYFRENSRMTKTDESLTALNRIKGMVSIRDCVRKLIEYQTEDYSEETIHTQQIKLNTLYEDFTKKYGLISSRANSLAFNEDSSYSLLSALEEIDEDGKLKRKADIFTKRTIKRHTVIESVDTASEALVVSISEKARIDIPYMCKLSNMTPEQIEKDLAGVIFRTPLSSYDAQPQYETADEYLSGNVRQKLLIAEQFAKTDPDLFSENVKALRLVQPKDLTASEISVRLGATWLPVQDVQNFMHELLDTPFYLKETIEVHFSSHTADWNISSKSRDYSNIKAGKTYGTDRANAYKILEETLNLRDVRIFDTVTDIDGKKTQVLNRKETTIAQQKQELIKSSFVEWLWKDPDRRNRLVRLYNDKFNATRPREYDGSHISLGGINPEISLRPHQVNAIAHILYGGNTLLAHVVGAGKTYEMVAAAMETKRLGLTQKSLFVVPNHLTEQWASEFLQLYPTANILVASKKDFETKNRKRFCGRIATGDYDAVIIGHSQFEKIPMSIERQESILRQQLDELSMGISELKSNRGENFTIKQLEKSRKVIKVKLEKLNDTSRKDDVVTFEELGVDRLFVDEAHYYKNLFLYTKMRNVGGIAQTEAQKSSDLYMKCRYLDEVTGGRGVVFATGTPISNSMVELYTMQRYLQYGSLCRQSLQHFDCWASTFGETVTAIELSPEGSGYRAKTRFAKFYNLPELMNTFKEVADIQTADMLNLPVPTATYHNVVIKPSDYQREMVADLSKRADRVRARMVTPNEDNMLLITNDGRKLALDQRLMNDLLPDSESSKTSACADNVFQVWEKGVEKKLTQLVFCDLSTPHYNGTFNVYDDIKTKLIEKGVPESDVAFIHDAKTDTQKKDLFAKVRTGQVRILIGSTSKMGAGTNVQDKLVAIHDLDCPWRPSDLEQRSGRILRQGNTNTEVDIFRYVTENTFDAYLYQLVENKQRFISQIMTSKSPVRSAEDIDEASLSYAEIKALATGNPHIKEKMDLDIEVARLKLLKASHLSQKYSLEDSILCFFPQQIKTLEESIEGYKKDMEQAEKMTVKRDDTISPMIIYGQTYQIKEEAGKAILLACKSMKSPVAKEIGSYRGFKMELSFDTFSKEYKLVLHNAQKHPVILGSDIYGNLTRLDHAIDSISKRLDAAGMLLSNTKVQLSNAKEEVLKSFAQEDVLTKKTERLSELNILLNMDDKQSDCIDVEPEETENSEPLKKGNEKAEREDEEMER